MILLSVVILLVGMFKPKWILFWVDNPTRLMVSGICMVVFMIGAVLFGEGNKQKREEAQKQAVSTVQTGKAVADKPLPEQVKPVTPPPPPAQAPGTSANDLRP